ncbi:MAG: response regulator [Flavobacteriales bacterium]
MPLRLYFEHKLIVVLLVVLLLVTASGSYTFNQLTNIVDRVSTVSQVDLRLTTFKSLINNVMIAENSVKSYNITRDTLWYESFKNASQNTIEKLDKLKGLNISRSDNLLDVDSLETLIYKKIEKLEDLLTVHDYKRVGKALNKVEKKIAKTSQMIQPGINNATKTNESENTPNTKKKSFSLFKSKKPEPVKTKLIDDIVVLEIVKSEVKKVIVEEENIDIKLKTAELELISVIHELSGNIWEMLLKFERDEYKLFTKKSAEIEAALKRTNQQIIYFYITICLLTIFMAYTTIKYVRKRRLYRRALKSAKFQAEDLAETKEKFIANISHEIRTPMNSIVGFTEQLAKTPLNEEQKDYLEMIFKSSEHLLYLVNDVLDYSKLKAEKVRLESIPFNLRCSISETTEFVQQLAIDKNIEIIESIEQNVPEVLIGDIFRIRQILLNLMSNAVKFCEEGSVKLTVKIAEKRKDNVVLLFEVADTGIGMSEVQIVKIFDEFEQAEASTARKYGGSGLGLSIVKMLVHLFHGEISIKSKLNSGTVVSVTLPLKIGNPSQIENQEIKMESPSTDFSYAKILVVDDEEFNRRLLTTILKAHHIDCLEATDGFEALDILKTEKIDLIFMDIRMPKLDGIETTKAIRLLNANNKNRIPIIALTAAVTEKDKISYYESGMNGFLQKPFKENELLRKLKKHLNKPNDIAPANINSVETSAFKPLVTKNLDLTELFETANSDQDFYYDMIKVFINNTRESLEIMRLAYEEKNWEKISNYAHKSSSPCRHISATNLYRGLKEIELLSQNKKDLKSIEKLIDYVLEQSIIVFSELENELSKARVEK